MKKKTPVYLNGRPAVDIQAKSVMWGASKKALLYEIDGKEKWVPRSVHKFFGEQNDVATLRVETWFYENVLMKEQGS